MLLSLMYLYLNLDVSCLLLTVATNLSLDSLTNPPRLVAANLLRQSLALLVGVQLGDVLVDSLAALVGVLKALPVADLLLT